MFTGWRGSYCIRGNFATLMSVVKSCNFLISLPLRRREVKKKSAKRGTSLLSFTRLQTPSLIHSEILRVIIRGIKTWTVTFSGVYLAFFVPSFMFSESNL